MLARAGAGFQVGTGFLNTLVGEPEIPPRAAARACGRGHKRDWIKGGLGIFEDSNGSRAYGQFLVEHFP